MERASFSSSDASTSPASGTSERPSTSTGTDGPAFFTFSPRSLIIARTLPKVVPAMMESPIRSVPFCTRTVATGPRPLSSCASMMTPRASRFGFALSSLTSATRRTISRRSFMPCFCFAETGTMMVSPPQSSGMSSCSDSSCFTCSGFAPGLSILLIATMMGTPADLAWLMASTVCGMTPSSAATTRIAMSVTCAPRARMAVNASWPGVSRKTIFFP